MERASEEVKPDRLLNLISWCLKRGNVHGLCLAGEPVIGPREPNAKDIYYISVSYYLRFVSEKNIGFRLEHQLMLACR